MYPNLSPTSNSNNTSAPLLLSFAAGIVTALIVKATIDQNLAHRQRQHAGAAAEGDDLSMFYDPDISKLTEITPSRRFLPADVYGQLVRDTVVCCVDIVCVRLNPKTKQKECLLVERSTHPVKGYWWLPGGRIVKGETIFAAAKRKAFEETGIPTVYPIQVLGVFNTFFPTSAWDTTESKGTQTVNPIVLVEMMSDDGIIKLDNTSERYRWIGLNPQKAQLNGEDKYVVQALYRLQAWDPSYSTNQTLKSEQEHIFHNKPKTLTRSASMVLEYFLTHIAYT